MSNECSAAETTESGIADSEDKEFSSHPDLLEFLSSAYEVLRKVFSFLNLEDLDNAARAYESWKPVAEVSKRSRCVLETFLLSDRKYEMSPIWSEAFFCITFCTAPNKELEEKATRYVDPEGETLSCLARTGVVGTLHDLSQIIQQKVRVELPLAPKKFYLSCLRIPKMLHVGIKTCMWEENQSFESFCNNFRLPDNEIIKCLLILMVAEESGRTASLQKDNFVSFLQKRQKESFAVGGCIVDDFQYDHGRKNPNDSVVKYIVFYGKNAEAASTVLTADVKSSAGIDEKVSLLKRKCPNTKKGALFVFRCTGRQRVLRRYKLKNDIAKWEGEALSKHFPGTPIVGCFGYGEFGNEHPWDNNLVSPKKKFRGSESWEFSFSTSLVYIGFKK